MKLLGDTTNCQNNDPKGDYRIMMALLEYINTGFLRTFAPVNAGRKIA